MKLITRWLSLIAMAMLVVACGSGTAGESPATGEVAATGEAATTAPAAATGETHAAGEANATTSAPGTTQTPATTHTPATTQAPATALVSGQVSAGPVTPVSRPGQPNTRPVAGAEVEALRGTHVVAVTRTDREGDYKLALPAGTYVISVTGAGYRLYPPRTRTVVAIAGQEVTVNFMLDTGIR